MGSGPGERSPVLPHSYPELILVAGARDWKVSGPGDAREETGRFLQLPQGMLSPQSVLRPGSRNRFLFLTTFFPMVTHFCSSGPKTLWPCL